MSGRVVAVLGISGVGKTTLVQAFTQRHPWAQSVRASALLKDTVAVDDTEALRTAPATSIQANQDRLAAAFADLRRGLPDRHIIFDGHSLIDNDQGLVVVPTSTFEHIAPNLIVFVEDAPLTIATRRAADTCRSRPFRSPDELAEHQATAKETALAYALALTVSLMSVRSGDDESFEKALLIGFGSR